LGGKLVVGQDQSAQLNIGHRRFDGLMAHVADRAAVLSGIDVVMPDHAKRGAKHQRKDRHGNYQAPDWLAVGFG
jgi:hypothetical protein